MTASSPLDIPAMAEMLLEPALALRKTWAEDDSDALRAIDNRRDAERLVTITKWLTNYGVHRIKNGPKRAAQAIIEYADDGRTKLHAGCDCEAIIEQFEKLYKKCSDAIDLRNKDGNGRDITSLTSKALWLCHPDVIPIYDGYAVSALQVISRLVPLNPIASKTGPNGPSSKYRAFIDIWHQLYDKAADVIRDGNSADHHNIRIFDAMLWLIGQNKYGSA